jgi:hypothetical protein
MPLLRELASALRSKNADPFITTCDVFIPDADAYAGVKSSGVLSPGRVAVMYGIPEEAVLGVYFIDAIQAVKVSFLKFANGKYIASGDLDDLDVLGAQQHAPLAEMEIPDAAIRNSRGPKGRRK